MVIPALVGSLLRHCQNSERVPRYAGSREVWAFRVPLVGYGQQGRLQDLRAEHHEHIGPRVANALYGLRRVQISGLHTLHFGPFGAQSLLVYTVHEITIGLVGQPFLKGKQAPHLGRQAYTLHQPVHHAVTDHGTHTVRPFAVGSGTGIHLLHDQGKARGVGQPVGQHPCYGLVAGQQYDPQAHASGN